MRLRHALRALLALTGTLVFGWVALVCLVSLLWGSDPLILTIVLPVSGLLAIVCAVWFLRSFTPDGGRRRDFIGWVRRRPLRAGLTAVVLVALYAIAVRWVLAVDYGTPTERVASPTGEFEVVQYEFTAVIDTGWNLTIERPHGGGREWFWRSVEGPAPESIRFTGPTEVEVVDQFGDRYQVHFDPKSLEPSERYCLRPGYCYDDPWDDYTRDGP